MMEEELWFWELVGFYFEGVLVGVEGNVVWNREKWNKKR